MTLTEEVYAKIDIDENLRRFLSMGITGDGDIEIRFPTFFSFSLILKNGNRAFIPLNAAINKEKCIQYRIRRGFADWRLKLEPMRPDWMDETGEPQITRDDEDGDGKKSQFVSLLQEAVKRYVYGEQYSIVISYVDYVDNGLISGKLPVDEPVPAATGGN